MEGREQAGGGDRMTTPTTIRVPVRTWQEKAMLADVVGNDLGGETHAETAFIDILLADEHAADEDIDTFRAENFRNRVLGGPATIVDGEEESGKGAIAGANERLIAGGRAPLPAKLTPHSLRRTFCSLLYALGEDPGTVMDEMGHTDPGLALRVYRKAMRRGEQETAELQALVEGTELVGASIQPAETPSPAVGPVG
jgi:hypothetical protein